jgi:hypothetical protein
MLAAACSSGAEAEAERENIPRSLLHVAATRQYGLRAIFLFPILPWLGPKSTSPYYYPPLLILTWRAVEDCGGV